MQMLYGSVCGTIHRSAVRRLSVRGISTGALRPRRLVPLLALALLGAPAAARAATSYQGDPAHTGHVAGSVATPPALVWSRELDGDPSFPIVLGDRVFTVVTSDADGGTLYALDRMTGEVLWRRAV